MRTMSGCEDGVLDLMAKKVRDFSHNLKRLNIFFPIIGEELLLNMCKLYGIQVYNPDEGERKKAAIKLLAAKVLD